MPAYLQVTSPRTSLLPCWSQTSDWKTFPCQLKELYSFRHLTRDIYCTI